MYKEKSPSLLLPVLTGLVLIFIFLSGITEMACLASYAGRANQTNFNKIKTLVVSDKSTPGIFSSSTTPVKQAKF